MKFTETQLEEIARYQESRGVTRAVALKACKRAWSKGFGGTKLRPFEKTDWYAWAGAERFHQGPGGEPLIAEVKVSGWPEEGDEEWAQYANTATLIVDKNGVSLNGANGAMQYNTDHDGAIKIANGLISNQPVDINSLAGSWESINMDEASGEEPIDDTTASMKGAMLAVNKAAKKAATPKALAPEKHFTVGSTDTVKRGFLKEMIDWASKQNSVTVASLFKKFGGRQIDGHKVHELRVRRYVSYCVAHGILKLVKGGK